MKNALLPLLTLAFLSAALPARAEDADSPFDLAGDASRPTLFTVIPLDQIKVVPLSSLRGGAPGQAFLIGGVKKKKKKKINPQSAVFGMNLLAGRVRSWGDASVAPSRIGLPQRAPDREPLTRVTGVSAPEPASLALLALGLLPLGCVFGARRFGYRLRVRSKNA